MTRAGSDRVAVVIASIDARATIQRSLARFQDEVAGRGDLIVVDASRDGTADVARSAFPSVRVLSRPPGRLAPELWRDGLNATDAPLVAFSTAQMVPRPGWLAALIDALDATGAAASGGPIVPGTDLAATDWAVYLLRFANYRPPIHVDSDSLFEPPGDNALYRRDRLIGLESAWAGGFWEAEIHRRLRARGEHLTLAPGAIVEFNGGNRLPATLPIRFDHARQYAAGRSRHQTLPVRLLRSVATPMVPAVLLARILRSFGRRIPRRAVPGLVSLSTAWALGELTGTWFGPPRRCRCDSTGRQRDLIR